MATAEVRLIIATFMSGVLHLRHCVGATEAAKRLIPLRIVRVRVRAAREIRARESEKSMMIRARYV